MSNDHIDADEEKSAYDALQKEMQNAKPRRDVFLPLVKCTFILRRDHILHTAASVQHILRDHPELKQPSAVSLCGASFMSVCSPVHP